jgi:hypothetical protein
VPATAIPSTDQGRVSGINTQPHGPVGPPAPDASTARAPANTRGSLSRTGLRQGGDTCETAFVISGLPFTDAGTTVGYTNDYQQSCYYVARPAPDVAYAFTPTQDVSVNISLCDPSTNFENALLVYEGSCAPENLLVCNEAVCATDSIQWEGVAEIDCVTLVANTTYYIVVDGTMGGEGDYVLDVTECSLCNLACGPEDILEGEPNCYTGYEDTYNGGCTDGGYFSAIASGETVCGTTGVYLRDGGFYYDVDTYELVLSSDATVTVTFASQTTLVMLIAANGGIPDCDAYINTQGVRDGITSTGGCMPQSLTTSLPAGTHWFMVRPNGPGTPCGSAYKLSIDTEPCTVPRGSCCLADGTCVDEVPAITCYEYYGSMMWVEGADCASADCSARLNGPTCHEAIELDIPSTTWGTTEGGAEVIYPSCGGIIDDMDVGSWYKVIGTGNRITATTCDANGLGDQCHMTVFCGNCDSPLCAAEHDTGTLCEGSTQYGNTITWCSQPGYEYYIWMHHWVAVHIPFDFILTVYDDGVPCDDYPQCEPPLGACCLGEVCYGDGMEEGECDAVGGRFYVYQTCGTMICTNDCPGDTWQTAVQIDALPYYGDGNTVPCMDHYYQTCADDPGGTSNDARDAVFQYTPMEDVVVDVSLCTYSKLNTKLSVYENEITPTSDPSTALACSNYACTSPGWPAEGDVSRVDCLQLYAGSTYYFVIDGGVFSHRGYFTIDVTEAACVADPCDITCSPGATPEGEPDLVEDYVDSHNGGCNSNPPVFSSISCGETVCGVSGTYAFGTYNYRDTDWYAITVTENTEFTVSLLAEFDAYVGFADNNGIADCSLASGYLFTGTEATACEAGSFTACLPAGEWWLVVLPQVYSGLTPPLEYELTVTCAEGTAAGACCLPDGTCTTTDENTCFDLDGVFQGAGTDCETSPCPGVPENDECVHATFLSVPSETLGTTINATWEQLTQDGGVIGVWYKLVGTGNAVTLSTCNEVTDFDTSIRVYCLGCDWTTAQYMRAMPIEAFPGEEVSPYQLNDANYRTDDDWLCRDHSQLASTHTLCTERGAEYLVVVYGYNGALGNFRLDVYDDGVPCVDEYNGSCIVTPANDACAAAEPIGDVTDLFWNTSFATNDGHESTGPDVWYCYTAPCSGLVTLTWEQVDHLSFDTAVAVYDGCTCGPTGGLLVASQPGDPLELTFHAMAGNQYLIMVGSWTNLGGAGWLTVTCETESYGACCLPDAPYCIDAFESECAGTFMGDGTICGTDDCDGDGIPDTCEVCGDLDNDADVDHDDYVIFLDAFGGVTDGVPPQDWCCDYDGSGAVGMLDYAAWLACYRDYVGDPKAPPPGSSPLRRSTAQPGRTPSPRPVPNP